MHVRRMMRREEKPQPPKEQPPISIRCFECGADRGGVINLRERPPVLRCHICTAKGK